MEKHFVVFYSPGTFMAETSERAIESWDVEKAKKMAHDIKERHNATPYGFQFITRSRKEDELDSNVSSRSCMYYLGGKVRTLQDLVAENAPENQILISNMRCNKWDKIIDNKNSWRWTAVLEDEDVVLDFDADTTEPKEAE